MCKTMYFENVVVGELLLISQLVEELYYLADYLSYC